MPFPDGAARPVPRDVPGASDREAPDVGVRPTGVPGPQPDAVRPDPQASYERALAAAPADRREQAIVSVQLGRPARGAPAVVHRCVYGLPTVVRVAPRLDDGTPFPTTFWLTCPVMRSRVGGLEADHAMVGLNERLGTDDEFAASYAAASERYVAARDQLGEPLPGNPSAGGMPGHIKCLHVHAGHTLATGDNVVGQWTVEHTTPAPCRGPCVTEGEVAARMERSS
ncbi:DUF501 domain-containing protein [Egicoccus sp. AB-alg6-2]|uniref:DUF501 domain-containing protein n=1 Tax=Egicoccus sp. AB-alg6-2 TaxID=3242692 RepID=UPI00359D095B